MLSDGSSSKKVVVIGSAKCGKTALVARAASSTFSPEYQQTFGADLCVKTVTDPKPCSLKIWCCGGHERYKPVFDQFYKGAAAALLCFDVQSQASFQEVVFWHNEIQRVSPDALIILVGTKADMTDLAVIKAQDATKQAKEWGVEYRQVSSKTGAGVDDLFRLLTESIAY